MTLWYLLVGSASYYCEPVGGGALAVLIESGILWYVGDSPHPMETVFGKAKDGMPPPLQARGMKTVKV